MMRNTVDGKTAPRKAMVMAMVMIVVMIGASAGHASAQAGSVSATGIGSAVLGSTAAEMRTALGPDYELVQVEAIAVDFPGYEVRKDGELQFHVGHQLFEDELTLIIVSDPAYTTAAGIGAGSTIAETEAAYGQVTLSYHLDNEGREFARFESAPGPRMGFRTGSFGDLAGIYTDPGASFGETHDYAEGADIDSIWISCVADLDCPADSLPRTGPAPFTVPLVFVGAGLIAGGTLLVTTARRCKFLFST